MSYPSVTADARNWMLQTSGGTPYVYPTIQTSGGTSYVYPTIQTSGGTPYSKGTCVDNNSTYIYQSPNFFISYNDFEYQIYTKGYQIKITQAGILPPLSQDLPSVIISNAIFLDAALIIDRPIGGLELRNCIVNRLKLYVIDLFYTPHTIWVDDKIYNVRQWCQTSCVFTNTEEDDSLYFEIKTQPELCRQEIQKEA